MPSILLTRFLKALSQHFCSHFCLGGGGGGGGGRSDEGGGAQGGAFKWGNNHISRVH